MKILALEGGGVLGYSQSVILSKLEDVLNKPVYQIFDLIGGTSVGAIIGAHLALGISALDIEGFFTTDAPKIFKKNIFTSLSNLWGAKYNPSALETALQERLKDATLADCKTKFIATAVEMNSGRNVYFQSYGKSSSDDTEIIIGPDSGIKLWQVARASSAAQSYFPGFEWNEMVFWDGGSTGNNAPDSLLYTEAFSLSQKTVRMMSIGVGKSTWPFIGKSMSNPNIISVLKATIAIAYGCVENNSTWMTQQELGNNYTRLLPKLTTSIAIDDASDASLRALKTAGDTVNTYNLNTYKNFIK